MKSLAHSTYLAGIIATALLISVNTSFAEAERDYGNGGEPNHTYIAPETSKPVETVALFSSNTLNSVSVAFKPISQRPKSLYIGENHTPASSINFTGDNVTLESDIDNTFQRGAILVTVYGPHTNIVLSSNAFYAPLNGGVNIYLTSPSTPITLNGHLQTQYSDSNGGTWTVIITLDNGQLGQLRIAVGL